MTRIYTRSVSYYTMPYLNSRSGSLEGMLTNFFGSGREYAEQL
jgi:hypothetical protein